MSAVRAGGRCGFTSKREFDNRATFQLQKLLSGSASKSANSRRPIGPMAWTAEKSARLLDFRLTGLNRLVVELDPSPHCRARGI